MERWLRGQEHLLLFPRGPTFNSQHPHITTVCNSQILLPFAPAHILVLSLFPGKLLYLSRLTQASALRVLLELSQGLPFTCAQ